MIVPLPDQIPGAPNDGKDKASAPRDESPKMYVREEKSSLNKQAELAQALGSLPAAGDLEKLPSSNPVVLPRGQAAVSEASSSASKVQRQVDQVDLANHVSLQIFSTDETKKNKNVILFLHGGPDLSYDNTFDNLTSWSIEGGRTLIAPEIAGSSKPGLSGTSDSFANPPNYVRDFQSVIHYFRHQPNFKEKEFCVVAHSWGGFQLASFLTDKNISAEDKKFIKQVVFMSPNLDSAHTRIFAMQEDFSKHTFENELSREMIRRHAGENSKSSETINFKNNPVMNKNLYENISPFYRLEQMPEEIPCLFIHPTKDTIVPASQSLAAMEKINSSGGNAKIVMATNGGHVFFKTGENSDLSATATCLGAIDSFIKNPDSLNKVVIDEKSLADSDLEKIEVKIKQKDDSYKSQKNLLDDWHQKTPENDEREGKPKNKSQILRELKNDKTTKTKIFEDKEQTNNFSYLKWKKDLLVINELINAHQ
jgi:alpha-beta hydrolase superfamily lysophospholipase